MVLDDALKQQCLQYFQLLEQPVILSVATSEEESAKSIDAFAQEIAGLSNKISIRYEAADRTPSLSLYRADGPTGIVFAALPLGHEFASFILALLQASGRPPKIADSLRKRIAGIQGTYHFETFVSLNCHICPDVVQAINILAILNPNISHTIIDGGLFREEADARDVMAVPSVFLKDELFQSGRISLEELVDRLSPADHEIPSYDEVFDVFVIGGGPAGASAAVYGARKGLKVGVVGKTIGGQILETVGIENLIGTLYIEGTSLAANLVSQMQKYAIDAINNQNVTSVEKLDDLFKITLENGAIIRAKTVIIATGARWRNVNVPGEQEFKNKGVAYCPHCDGPLFAGKRVAVIGGGNSGIEAAIDLSNLVKEVTVLEFLPELKADKVLQDKLKTLANVKVITNAATTEIHGTDRVTGISFKDRVSNAVETLQLDGVFVQIGLVPNTDWITSEPEKNKIGEIITAKNGSTSVPGLFAAGDCTDSSYKQIIISMGSGATAALSAFDYLIRSGK